ncbi:MAG: hypothetical protein F6J93_17750 [Oscillatoria sp. SIO1A7]|nr:hypothetical protein [Oscillatoria sp. SIO1A7]
MPSRAGKGELFPGRPRAARSLRPVRSLRSKNNLFRFPSDYEFVTARSGWKPIPFVTSFQGYPWRMGKLVFCPPLVTARSHRDRYLHPKQEPSDYLA